MSTYLLRVQLKNCVLQAIKGKIMSLAEKIKKDQFESRKNKDAVKASLLTTLYSEVSMKGKNAGRETSDDEAIQVIQKFLKGVNETIGYLEKDLNKNEALEVAKVEKNILEGYLPKMASIEDIRAEISSLKSNGITNLGAIMKGLKDKFGSSLDGKLASQLAKE